VYFVHNCFAILHSHTQRTNHHTTIIQSYHSQTIIPSSYQNHTILKTYVYIFLRKYAESMQKVCGFQTLSDLFKIVVLNTQSEVIFFFLPLIRLGCPADTSVFVLKHLTPSLVEHRSGKILLLSLY
jgi:hypothetical protein